ncbi:MAG TPA: hypothetical protein VF676_04910 [Flavobacterium sp.]|jgi:hypothetical protein
MYEILRQIHTVWACLTLLILVIAVVNSIAGFSSKREFNAGDKRLGLFALTAAHIQFLIGIILYFNSPLGIEVLGEMKNASLRLTSMEHPLVNLIAVTLITIGWSRHKKFLDSKPKFKSLSVFYGIGLLLILSRIPWNLLSDVISDLL